MPGIIKKPSAPTLFLCVNPNDPSDCTGANAGQVLIEEVIVNLPLIQPDNPSTPNVNESWNGLGAFEFQVKFDHKLVDVSITEGPLLASTGRTTNCELTIFTENWQLFGCVSAGASPQGPAPNGVPAITEGVAAVLTIRPQGDLVNRMRPTKLNGVVATLLDENCEIADTFGNPPQAAPTGLLSVCEDASVSIRMLQGDVNLDCEVDIDDEQSTAFRYGTFFGSLLYDDFFDLEPWLPVYGDFDIDIKDIQMVFGRDGSTCESPIPSGQ
jgi:hypothetical protein